MSDMASVVTRLEASLTTKIGSTFNIDEPPDIVATMLANLRSPNTRRAYSKDINDFFRVVVDREPTRDLVLEFLHLEQVQAVRNPALPPRRRRETGCADVCGDRRYRTGSGCR